MKNWLSELISKGNIHFFQGEEAVRYNQPYLQSRILPAISGQGDSTVNQTTEQCNSSDDNSLFLLRIQLLEIGLGAPIERLRKVKEDIKLVGNDYVILRDYLVANKLAERTLGSWRGLPESCTTLSFEKSCSRNGYRRVLEDGVQ